jgi:hypothetical protein
MGHESTIQWLGQRNQLWAFPRGERYEHYYQWGRWASRRFQYGNREGILEEIGESGHKPNGRAGRMVLAKVQGRIRCELIE